MKVLVTGGAGFIGSHLTNALIAAGHRVVVIDNLTPGKVQNVNSAARLYKINVNDERLVNVFDQERPEIMYHQAAHIMSFDSTSDAISDIRENIVGSVNVVMNCVRFKVRKIIYASSAATYGKPHYLPVDENHPVNPISLYGVSKLTVEHYLHLYALHSGLTYTILRYASVYGARQNPGGGGAVVATFICQMLEGNRPTIFGLGDKTRDYIHVSDVVQANLLVMEKGNNATYNIGTGVQTSDSEIFDSLAKLLDYRDQPHYASVRTGEIHHICLDITKAQQELGWQPRLSVKEGLLQTVHYYQTQAWRKSK